MRAVILAGGLGTRLSEETILRPKPMVEIGGRPILWHLMKIYSHYGVNDFIICCGYKGYIIKEYFANYFLHTSDVTFDIKDNKMTVHQSVAEPWRVTLVDTGENTGTGGRLLRVAQYLDDDFCMTYGDGLADIDISRLIMFHQRSGRLATVTAVKPPARFGALKLDGHDVLSFQEKSDDDGWVNGGFFVLSPYAFKAIANDATMFEQEPMQWLTSKGQIEAYYHQGFWQCMDTMRDKQKLEELWNGGKALWKVW